MNMQLIRGRWFYAVTILISSLVVGLLFAGRHFTPDFGPFRAVVLLPGIFSIIQPAFLQRTSTTKKRLDWLSQTQAVNQLYLALFTEVLLTLLVWLSTIVWHVAILRSWDAAATLVCLAFNLLILYFVVALQQNTPSQPSGR